jgi:hypothetical protein
LLTAAVGDGVYNTLMAVHVLMAVVWVGGGLMLTLQAERAKHETNSANFVDVAMSAEFWSTRVFIPAALLLFLCGLGMVMHGHVGFSKPFVDIGLAAWLLSFAIGTGFLGPQGGKVKALYASSGGEISDVMVARVNRILTVARVDLAILLTVVVVMVVKPGGGLP